MNIFVAATSPWITILSGVLWLAVPSSAWGWVLWIGWRWDRAKGRSRCPRCWYDLSTLPSETDGKLWSLKCPECGKTLRDPNAVRQTRRHRGLIALACFGAIVHLWYFVGYVLDRGPLWAVPSAVLFHAYDWTKGGTFGTAIPSEILSRLNQRRILGTLSAEGIAEYVRIQTPSPLLSVVKVPHRWVRGTPLAVAIDTKRLSWPLSVGLSGRFEIFANDVMVGSYGMEELNQSRLLGSQWSATSDPMVCVLPESISWNDLRLSIRIAGTVKNHDRSQTVDLNLNDQGSYAIKSIGSISEMLPPSTADVTTPLERAWHTSEFPGGLLCSFPNLPVLAGVAIGVRIELRHGSETIAVGRAYLPNTSAGASMVFVPMQRVADTIPSGLPMPKIWSWVISSDDNMAALGELEGCTSRWVGSFSERILFPPSEEYLRSIKEVHSFYDK